MNKEILIMMKRVSIYNLIIGVMLTIVTYIIFNTFAVPFLCGLIVGIVNFIISSSITNNLFTKAYENPMLKYMVSFVLRVSLISVIGYALYIQNKYFVFAYVGGYSAHLLGISIYSLNLKK